MITEKFFRAAYLLILSSLFWFSMPCHAAEGDIILKDFKFIQTNNPGQLIAEIEFDYQLNDYLRNSLQNGITLHNEIRFDVETHSDWWWNKKKPLDRIRTDLKYNALSQQYQVINKENGENWNFPNLPAALIHLGTLKNHRLPVLPDSVFEKDTSIYIEAVIGVENSKALDLSKYFSSDKRSITSQGIMWPITP